MVRKKLFETLLNRLTERRRFIQILFGPRQVGKTTLVRQVLARLALPAHYASADEATLQDRVWIQQQWEAGRLKAANGPAVLVFDEIQKVPNWSTAVKALWDADAQAQRPLQVVLLGSAPLPIRSGAAESLAGRFEIIYVPHWSFPEMREAFGWNIDEYIFYGAYPGAAQLIPEPARWRRYVLDALIETTISRDILQMTRVDKPALLRRLFQLGCAYTGQILSYQKMIGQLTDAGNTVTLAHYLDLLHSAGMLTGLSKYSPGLAQQRASSPKFLALNAALVSAQNALSPAQAKADGNHWGRLVETCVGAHLVNTSFGESVTISYWRERNHEVDFVISDGGAVVAAVEVKSGLRREALPGMNAFARRFKPGRLLLVGGADGIALEDFLTHPAGHWLR